MLELRLQLNPVVTSVSNFMVERPYLNNTWIALSETAYANNLQFFKQIIGRHTELAAVIKANAYGHGWQSIARLAVKHGVNSFCVHSLEEGLRLRRAGFRQKILILGHVPFNRLEAAVAHDFRLAVFNRETLERLDQLTEAAGKLTRIHLKLETGTFRQGIGQEELPGFLEKLKKTPRVILEAVYTHFADIEDTLNRDYAEYQQYHFHKLVQIIREKGFPILKQHAACTAAALLFEKTHLDLVRLGIGQYGFWPSKETLISYKEKHGPQVEQALRPVLSWKTRISQVKWVPVDNTIGYGRSYKTTRDTRIAILPIGYSDGFDRRLSNRGYVLIRGKRAPVRGRICMNLTMVDITDIPGVQVEDEVVLIGSQGDETITVEQIAALCGTIHYEIISRLNPEIPRVVVDEIRAEEG